MTGVTIVVKVDCPGELKGAELKRMVTKALERIQTKSVKVLSADNYRTEDFEAFMRSVNPHGRAVRKTVKLKQEVS